MLGENSANAARLVDALVRDLMTCLPYELGSTLRRLSENGGCIPLSDMAPGVRVELEARLPHLVTVDREADELRFAVPGAARAFASALAAESGEPSVLGRLQALLRKKRLTDAMERFEQEGGAFFAHIHGVQTAKAAVNAFPEEIRAESDVLTMADAINAMKSGNLAYADGLVTKHFGPGLTDLVTIARDDRDMPLELACFCFVRAVYREEPLGDAEHAYLMACIARVSGNQHLLCGLFHNVALDLFIRRRQWATAAETAERARFHLAAAKAPLLIFYIDLHRFVISLARVDHAEGRAALADAALALAAAPGATANDAKLLEVLTCIADYEAGDATPLTAFALKLNDDSLFGEIWPSMAEPIITYGALTLCVHSTLASVRFFLDRWKAGERETGRFRQIVMIREVEALQRHGRVREAEEALVAAGIGLSGDDAGTMGDDAPSDVDLALVGLRAGLTTAPADRNWALRLDRLAGLHKTTPRQKAEIALLKAVSAEARRDGDGFREALLQFYDIATEQRLPALLAENATLLKKLATTRGNRRLLTRSPRLQRYLAISLHNQNERVEEEVFLTAQEERIVMLLAEATPNKEIAARLGISVPTVRFHAKNIYRKLGIGTRADLAKRVDADIKISRNPIS